MEEPVHSLLVLTLLTAVSLQWTLLCVRAESIQGSQSEDALDSGSAEQYKRFLSDNSDLSGDEDLIKRSDDILSEKRFGALSGDLGKRYSSYRMNLAKRMYQADLGKRSRDGAKRFNADLGKRGLGMEEVVGIDGDDDDKHKRYNFDLGKRYNFDLGKRYNFDLGKRYKVDLGKRYNFDLGKRDNLADVNDDVASKRYSYFNADMGKRTLDEDQDEKRFRYGDLGKRAGFRTNVEKRSPLSGSIDPEFDFIKRFNADLGKRSSSGIYGLRDYVRDVYKRPMYRVDMGKRAGHSAELDKRYNFDLGKRSFYDWKRIFNTDLGR